MYAYYLGGKDNYAVDREAAEKVIATTGATIKTVYGGNRNRSPLLLLHGIPETHVLWRKVAPALARDYFVVMTDLRGYGDSSKPPGGEDHFGLWAIAAKPFFQIETGFLSWHVYIAKHQIHSRVVVEHHLGLGHVTGLEDAISALLEILGHANPDRSLVFHDEDRMTQFRSNAVQQGMDLGHEPEHRKC